MTPPPPEEQTIADPQSLSFEEAFTRLGEVAETLEAGGLPLAQAAALYAQGMGLARRCSQLLEETELKITQLRENGGASAAPANAPSDLTPGPGLAWENMEMPPEDEQDWDLPPWADGDSGQAGPGR